MSSHDPDLVILDVGLPGIDRFEVCPRLRADGDETPVIFLTARDTAEDHVGLRLLGGRGPDLRRPDRPHDRRLPAGRRRAAGLATSRYPDATFVPTEPIPVASVPAEGERITVTATGVLTSTASAGRSRSTSRPRSRVASS